MAPASPPCLREAQAGLVLWPAIWTQAVTGANILSKVDTFGFRAETKGEAEE